VASPKEQLLLVDITGTLIEVDELVEKLRSDEARVLADDEVGLIIYVGDLEYYNLTPTETGEFLAQPVTQVSRPRFPVNVLRKQIGARVFSVTEDAVFVIREGSSLRKVRAGKLEPGMVLASGEKVFR
jgi:hypothetical protein